MNTEVFTDNLQKPAEIIKGGGLVAVPTETVYGLAGNGLDEKAVADIYEVKGRPAVKPLALMVDGIESIDALCEDVPQQAYFLAERFWPGPITIVLKSKEFIPQIVRAGGSTIGLRCPDSMQTLKLIRLAGVPLAAPSANPSGEESPTSAQSVLNYFKGKIPAVIDGGDCPLKIASTLIDMSTVPYKILRAGALSRDDIADALAENMKIIGISGGSGCGKTTALNAMQECGAYILDCDKVYHNLLEINSDMLEKLKAAFPDAFTANRLDRKKLGDIVFVVPEKLSDLNAITHPFIAMEIKSLLREAAMNGCTSAVIDASELFESDLTEMCDATFAVLADREKRLERIIGRDNITKEYAEKRISNQHSDSYFIDKADFVIYNNSSEEAFREECILKYKEAVNNG